MGLLDVLAAQSVAAERAVAVHRDLDHSAVLARRAAAEAAGLAAEVDHLLIRLHPAERDSRAA
jgi:hypothetical protein